MLFNFGKFSYAEKLFWLFALNVFKEVIDIQ